MASHTAAAADHPEPLKHQAVTESQENSSARQQVPGVYNIDIEIRQQRVVVTGDVQADTLIKKLVKPGKNAELWPMMVAEVLAMAVKKAKEVKPESAQEDCTSGHGGGDQREGKPPGKVAVVIQEPPAKKSEEEGVCVPGGEVRAPPFGRALGDLTEVADLLRLVRRRGDSSADGGGGFLSLTWEEITLIR